MIASTDFYAKRMLPVFQSYLQIYWNKYFSTNIWMHNFCLFVIKTE